MLRRASHTLLWRYHQHAAAAAAAGAAPSLSQLLLPSSTAFERPAPHPSLPLLHRAYAAPAEQQQQQPAASTSTSTSTEPSGAAGTAAAPREALKAHTHRIDFKMATLGSVVAPYKGAPPPLGFSWPLSADGRKAARQRLTEFFALGLAIASLMQSVPNFSFKHLKPAFAELFTTISRAFVEDRLEDVRDLVDAAELKRMSAERDAWRRRLWDRADWRLDGELSLKDMALVQGRLVKLHREASTAFVQLTVRVPSRQRFAAYSRASTSSSGRGGGSSARGNNNNGGNSASGSSGASAWELVAGDPSEVIDVVDHWVFERKIHSAPPGAPSGGKFRFDPPRARWRLVKRLTLAAGGGSESGGGGGGESDAAR